MIDLLLKIWKTPKTVIDTEILFEGDGELATAGTELAEGVRKLFRGSLAIREVAAGSSNAEEQELTALTNAYYDIERLGVHFVASPRHADMLMVTGPVSRNMIEGVKRTYEAMPTPKLVVAVGDGAIDGGIFRGSYGIVDSLSDVIPVDYEIPGDPPSPKEVIRALNDILRYESKKRGDS
jgi:Ni,Fe-hydrogenase III small subunit